MDIYSYLKKDHRKVSDLLDQAASARSDKRREELYTQIRDELLLHAKTEEATFYAALEEKQAGQPLSMLLPEAEKEHDELRDLFSKMERCGVGTAKWLVHLGELKHAVTHHVEEEEEHIFEQARELLSPDEARELARRMEALKQQEEPTPARLHDAPKAA